MPQNRPSIPAEIEREVMVEAGHRCAVCGAESPLELAHIKPWSSSREHSVKNLICLCANCHQRADNGKWKQKDLREYKKRPWVNRARLGEAATRGEILSSPPPTTPDDEP